MFPFAMSVIGKYCDRNEAIEEEQSGVGETSHGVVTPKDCPAGNTLLHNIWVVD